MTDIAAWLAEKGLAKHVDAFRDNDIHFDILASLGDEELKELGLSLGDRKRLQRAIAEGLPQPPSSGAAAVAVPERRQLTVVFADLVDSTVLSRSLDPEDLRDVMRGYHDAVAEAMRGQGGFIAKFMGDGVLAYFGFPLASEDAAERAVRAALRVVGSVRSLSTPDGRSLASRVGVATGSVVVGDVMGDELAREVNVVGETPNLAARLIATCGPNEIVVSEATRRLIGEQFVLSTVGPLTLKGFDEPVRTFQVVAERQGISRFEATRRTQGPTLVGRAQEVGLLVDRWQQARLGDGQVVLLSGEAGIGKSKVADALWQQVEAEGGHRMRYQCTPQHANSPFYPAIMQLTAAAGIRDDESAEGRRSKIAAAVRGVDEDQLALVEELLGVPLPAESAALNLAPARKRELLLQAFAQQILEACSDQPTFLLVEDAHWIDPTTEEMISRVVDGMGGRRLLIVTSHRPEYAAPWSTAPMATQLTLNRLSRGHVVRLLGGLAGGKAVPTEVLDYVLARADGVPLFMEELFQALCDSGALVETEEGYRLVRPLAGAEIPATLQDSLMARLDRLTAAKSVAQYGAAIGREFQGMLLSKIVNLSSPVVQEGLSQLVSAGMLFARGSAPNTVYSFKHALVQEVAYGSMLRQRRQEVHARIADVLVGQASAERPEVIAHHLEAAGSAGHAAIWLEGAADASGRSGAHREAIYSWRRVLELQQESSGAVRDRVRVLMKLSAALIQVDGYHSAEASEIAAEASRLARETGDSELYASTWTTRSSTMFARREFAVVEAELSTMGELDLEVLPTRSRVLGHCMRGIVAFHLGRIAEAVARIEEIRELDGDDAPADALFGGGDARSVCRYYLSRALVIQGRFDAAEATANEALAVAKALNQPFSIAWSMIGIGRVNSVLGRLNEALAWFDDAARLCARYGYAARLAQARLGRGVTLIGSGDLDAGCREADKGLDDWQKTAGSFGLETWVMEVAEACLQAGYPDAAQHYWEQAAIQYAEGPERVTYADFLRMEGVLKAREGNIAGAKRLLHEAVDTAATQGAGLYFLRATLALARLLSLEGDAGQARDVLAPVCASFTEGPTAPDLVHARAFLRDIAAL